MIVHWTLITPRSCPAANCWLAKPTKPFRSRRSSRLTAPSMIAPSVFDMKSLTSFSTRTTFHLRTTFCGSQESAGCGGKIPITHIFCDGRQQMDGQRVSAFSRASVRGHPRIGSLCQGQLDPLVSVVVFDHANTVTAALIAKLIRAPLENSIVNRIGCANVVSDSPKAEATHHGNP